MDVDGAGVPPEVAALRRPGGVRARTPSGTSSSPARSRSRSGWSTSDRTTSRSAWRWSWPSSRSRPPTARIRSRSLFARSATPGGAAHERRRHRRHRHAPVRPPPDQRARAGRASPPAGRSPTPASPGPTSSTPSAARRRPAPPTRWSSDLGLTGVPFINVANGCATGGSALISAYNAIRAGAAEVVMAIGFDKHPAGRLRPDAGRLRPRRLVRRDRADADDAVLRDEDPALHARARHQPSEALAKVAAKAFRNGSLNPNAWRRTPMSEDQILDAAMIADPLTQYMFCSPGRGRRGARADHRRAGTERSRRRRCTCARPCCGRGRSARSRCSTRRSPTSAATRRPSPPRPGRSRWPASAPSEIDVVQVQDTESGAEVMHLAECGFCADGEQEDLIRSGATEIGGALPVNTDGGCLANGEPIGGVRAAPGARVGGPAARRRRRTPGARRPADGVHPRLRRPRHLRLHGPVPLTPHVYVRPRPPGLGVLRRT